MSHTNRLRVVLGGLLAGVVINLVEYVTNGVILRNSWAQTMQALGKPAEVSAGAIVTFNVWGFLVGIAAVWVYAAIRPRFGIGVKTAVYAGGLTWVTAYALATAPLVIMGVFPMNTAFVLVAVGLVEIVVATIAGAWLYQEA